MKRLIVLWAFLLAPVLWAQQVAVKEYVLPNGMKLLTVALCCTKKSEQGEAEDPLFAGLSDQEKVQVRQFKQALVQMPIDEARAIMQKLEPQRSSAPSDNRNFVEVLHKLLQMKVQSGEKQCDGTQ